MSAANTMLWTSLQGERMPSADVVLLILAQVEGTTKHPLQQEVQTEYFPEAVNMRLNVLLSEHLFFLRPII